MNHADRTTLEATLGHTFHHTQWLERALTHPSRRAETDRAAAGGDNERLEFLGDAVLGLVVGEYLLGAFPHWQEGQLSKSKARLVSAPMLHEAAQRLGLGRYLELGSGEEKTGGREKRAVLADAYEAVVAAVYLDGGLAAAAGFVQRSLVEPALGEHGEALGESDHKSALQELLQARGAPPAEYRVVQETGPDHRKRFLVEVWVQGRPMASSEGSSKKQAEQAAAQLALGQLLAEASTR